jgi:threonine dehydratase
MAIIDLKKFKDAQKIVQQKTLNIPLFSLDSITTVHGNPIMVKAECLQPSGSFKIRGAAYCLSLLSQAQKDTGVIAYSTGNHAQSVALAAKTLGIKATIVMSPNAPQFKIDATKKYGATVVMSDPSSQARRLLAQELAKSHGYYLVPPYDDLDVITGQGTIGIEILEEVNPAAIFVPIGGGGLIAGIALAVKQSNSAVKIIGVEPELENDAVQSFQCGKLVSLSGPSTSCADAIKVQTLGDITFPIIRDYVDDIVSVSEQQIIEAMLMHADKAHIIVEPAGALALAAALTYKNTLEKQKPVVCIASGGNIPYKNFIQLVYTQ